MHLFALCVSWSRAGCLVMNQRLNSSFQWKKTTHEFRSMTRSELVFFHIFSHFTFHFSTFTRTCTVNSSFRIRLSGQSSTAISWSVGGKTLVPNQLNGCACHHLAARRAIKNVGAFWSLPDLTPCDFILFTKLKFKLKGHCCDRAEIKHLQVIWMGLPG